jgi:hypothetical protein
MQDAKKQFSTPVLGIAGNGEQCFGSGGEEQVVTILLWKHADSSGSEDHVEILGGQQLGLRSWSIFPEPHLTLGAMTAAARAVDGGSLAVVAPFNRTAQMVVRQVFGLHLAMMQGQRMGLPQAVKVVKTSANPELSPRLCGDCV